MKLPANPVVYQIYPRSFQDSNGDGLGDLPGITSRLDYLQRLGVNALWMSPIFRSPMHDYGYDVSDYRDIAPDYGSMADIDTLISEAKKRDIAVLLDMVLPHTSIEHPWFRERPDFYIWRDTAVNNWPSNFGGSVWQHDDRTGRYYFHKYYPEQPDLNWRNPEVRAAMYDVMRFWLDRGVSGFRLDAIDGLYKRDDMADMPPSDGPSKLPYPSERQGLAAKGYMSHLPETIKEMADLRASFPDAWFVTEAFRPIEDLAAYTQHLDVAFNFELLFASFNAPSFGAVLRRSPSTGMAWALSNHDFSRLVTRAGRDMAKVAAMIVLTLPGATFIYQGDELGMVDGPGASGEAFDRMGRDAFRHPMQWTPAGGFSSAEPWLPMTDPQICNAQDQEGDPQSMFEFYRRLIEIRRDLHGELKVVQDEGDLLVYEHGNHSVVCNFSEQEQAWNTGEVLLRTADAPTGTIAPRSALLAHRA